MKRLLCIAVLIAFGLSVNAGMYGGITEGIKENDRRSDIEFQKRLQQERHNQLMQIKNAQLQQIKQNGNGESKTIIITCAEDCIYLQGASIIGQDDKHTFLGKIASELDSDSIFNSLGEYGSRISSTSIFNDISEFGSEISSTSAFNDMASAPPMIVLNGQMIGYLTTNSILINQISPYLLLAAKDNFYGSGYADRQPVLYQNYSKANVTVEQKGSSIDKDNYTAKWLKIEKLSPGAFAMKDDPGFSEWLRKSYDRATQKSLLTVINDAFNIGDIEIVAKIFNKYKASQKKIQNIDIAPQKTQDAHAGDTPKFEDTEPIPEKKIDSKEKSFDPHALDFLMKP